MSKSFNYTGNFSKFNSNIDLLRGRDGAGWLEVVISEELMIMYS